MIDLSATRLALIGMLATRIGITIIGSSQGIGRPVIASWRSTLVIQARRGIIAFLVMFRGTLLISQRFDPIKSSPKILFKAIKLIAK
jgi:hypothetical protein